MEVAAKVLEILMVMVKVLGSGRSVVPQALPASLSRCLACWLEAGRISFRPARVERLTSCMRVMQHEALAFHREARPACSSPFSSECT
jgi:hypothetical protein